MRQYGKEHSPHSWPRCLSISLLALNLLLGGYEEKGKLSGQVFTLRSIPAVIYLLNNFYQVLKVQKNSINNYKIFNTLKVTILPIAVVQLPEYKSPWSSTHLI